MKGYKESEVKRCNGIASIARTVADRYGVDKDLIYCLAKLIPFNAEQLGEYGFRYSEVLKFERQTPDDYCMYHSCGIAMIPKELIALWSIDLCVSDNGEFCGYAARMQEIQKKFGKDSQEAWWARETYIWLKQFHHLYDNTEPQMDQLMTALRG